MMRLTDRAECGLPRIGAVLDCSDTDAQALEDVGHVDQQCDYCAEDVRHASSPWPAIEAALTRLETTR